MSTLFVSGSVNISGTYKINGEEPYQKKENITTAEQATGEKFLGRDVYVKGWEGILTGLDTIVSNFFPTTACRLVSWGGDRQQIATSQVPIVSYRAAQYLSYLYKHERELIITYVDASGN
jgi:hypothetical protein